MEEIRLLGTLDLVMCVAMLAISLAIGIYFSYRDRKDTSTKNYYFGKGNLSAVPVGISLTMSLVSAVTIISFPMEVYKYGTAFSWVMPQVYLSSFIASVYFIPTYRKLDCKSVYEVLELRYSNKIVRLSASVSQLIFMLVKMGITMYLPALALSAVTPLKLNWVIAITTIICTLYTSMGGVKAVIWTDVVQTCFMLTGMIAVFIKTFHEVRNEDVLQVIKDAGRWNVFDFTVNPTQRMNFWNVNGLVVSLLYTYCCDQAYVQRYIACKTTRDAQLSTLISTVSNNLLTLLSLAIGCVTFVYFNSCDPVYAGHIKTGDQTIPYLALLIFRHYPGLAGLFVTAVYGGSLSTLSSGLSASSVIVMEDFLSPALKLESSKKHSLNVGRVISCILGLIVMVLAYVSAAMGPAAFRFLLTVHAVLGAAVFGAFILALFIPWSNWKGALFGQIIGAGFACFLTFGAIMNNKSIRTNYMIPLLNQTCVTAHLTNTTITSSLTNNISNEESSHLITFWFSLSHYLYGPIVLFVTVVSGTLISFITGPEKPSNANPMLFVPFIDNKLVPLGVRRFFRLGVPEVDRYTAGKETSTIN